VDLTRFTVQISRAGATGWNFIGTPFPAKRTMGLLNPVGAADADEIWIWDESVKRFTSKFARTAWTAQELQAGKCYLYYRSVLAPFDWQINY
jgi:hypothetical protein